MVLTLYLLAAQHEQSYQQLLNGLREILKSKYSQKPQVCHFYYIWADLWSLKQRLAVKLPSHGHKCGLLDVESRAEVDYCGGTFPCSCTTYDCLQMMMTANDDGCKCSY